MVIARERPVVFSAAEVRAVLEDRKTQMRRAVKPQPQPGQAVWPCHYSWRVGDHLWVKETWATFACYDYCRPSQLSANSDPWHYQADGVEDEERGKWRNAIHMPRHISRLTLEITDLRAQRLQEITEADAIAEGIEQSARTGGYLPGNCSCARWAYEILWDQNHYKAPGLLWEDNPHVWVITFRRINENGVTKP